METQHDIKTWHELTEEVARHICQEIMGFDYSHHQNNVCYKGDPYNDYEPMIYFYQGQSPAIMKLNTQTGEMHYADSYNLIEKTYDLAVSLSNEIGKAVDSNNPVAIFRKNAEKVYQYLIEHDYFISTRNWEINYVSCEGNNRHTIAKCREEWEAWEVESRFRESMGGCGDDPAEFISAEWANDDEWDYDYIDERN